MSQLDARKSIEEILLDGSMRDILSSELCELLSNHFRANKAVIIKSKPDQSKTFFSSFGVDQSSIDAYAHCFHELDPMRHVGMKSRVSRMSDVVSRDVFDRSKFCNDFFKPMNSYHSLSAFRALDHGCNFEVALNRGVNDDDFDRPEKQELKEIIGKICFRHSMDVSYSAYDQEDRSQLSGIVCKFAPRELEMFVHLSTGKTVSEFSKEYSLSTETSRDLAKSIRSKLGLKSQHQIPYVAAILLPPKIG